MTITQEVQVVVHIDPGGVGFREQALHVRSLAIGKIQSQFSLAMVQSLETKVLSVGQPVHPQQPLIGLVGNRNPMGRSLIHGDHAHAHDRVVLPRLGINLMDQARVYGRKIHERAHGHAGLVGLKKGDRLRIG